MEGQVYRPKFMKPKETLANYFLRMLLEEKILFSDFLDIQTKYLTSLKDINERLKHEIIMADLKGKGNT